MEEKIISEEQLEIMRHKARKRQNIAIVLTFLAFVLYIGMFYVALIEKEGMSVLFVVKIVFAAAVLAIATFGLLWYIVVHRTYEKFNSNYKSKYVIQVLNGIPGFEGLEYHPEGGFHGMKSEMRGLLRMGKNSTLKVKISFLENMKM